MGSSARKQCILLEIILDFLVLFFIIDIFLLIQIISSDIVSNSTPKIQLVVLELIKLYYSRENGLVFVLCHP